MWKRCKNLARKWLIWKSYQNLVLNKESVSLATLEKFSKLAKLSIWQHCKNLARKWLIWKRYQNLVVNKEVSVWQHCKNSVN